MKRTEGSEMSAVIRAGHRFDEGSSALEEMGGGLRPSAMVMNAVYEEHRELMPPQHRAR
jgi:hypothetical protein